MPSPPRVPKVAGYLPYHPPRFVSLAEEAAKKLPPTIKAQSLKNALLRQGAKPLELEYAGIDDFIAQQQAIVNSADVIRHLQEQGPLGQLKRVEQAIKPGGGHNGGAAPEKPTNPGYAPNTRAPFDMNSASDSPVYQAYTVPGSQGDFTGYREVLIEDPKNRPGGQPLVKQLREEDQSFLDYANGRLPELDAAQPYQQPLQAEYAALIEEAQRRGIILGYQPDGTPFFHKNGNATPIDAHASDYWARYNEYPDRIALQNIQSDVGQAASNSLPARENMTMDEANDLIHRWEMGEIHADERIEQAGRMIGHPDFDGPTDPATRPPQSPVARDDNWKNLMARHIALQSIAGGGKPITIPTGKQMVDVERFGLRTHSDPNYAAWSAFAYNTDIALRLQKIFRGLDPSGAEVRQVPMHDPYTTAATYDREALSAAAGKARRLLQSTLKKNGRRMSVEEFFSNRPEGDRRVFRALNKWSMGELTAPQAVLELAYEVNGRRVSPEFQDAAMQVIQRHYLNTERGENAPPPPDPSAPGWTIKPSPEAVRAALERGLPIMSLAPLLLAPAAEDRQ